MLEAIREHLIIIAMKNFKIRVIHAGDDLSDSFQDVLRGGMTATGCGNLTSCGCYKGYVNYCNRNTSGPQKPPVQPDPTPVPPPQPKPKP